MTSFTKPNLRALHAELDTTLRTLGAKHGINFATGKIHFTSTDFRCQLTASIPVTHVPGAAPTGVAAGMSKDEVKFRQCARALGVQPDDYGKVITVGRRQYNLVGAMPQGIHYKFIGQTVGGTGRYKLTQQEVLASLGAAPAVAPANPEVVAASSPAILNEVRAIVAEASAASTTFLNGSGADNVGNWMAREKQIEDRLAAVQRLIGKGLQVGKEIRFQIADGYARYIVTEVGPKTTKVAHLKLGDAWQSPAVFNGTLSTAHATQLVQRAEAFAEIFASRAAN